jgi:uncharacterized damage-inducible protein DinB
MTIDDLRMLLDYHYWARDRVLDAVQALTQAQYTKDMGSSFKSVRDTAAHILGAEIGWYKRWHKEPVTALSAAEHFPDVPVLRRAWTEHESRMRAFVESLGDAGSNRTFEYRLVSGAEGKVTYGQSLQHVVNHGSYHRGQVVTMLRQLGAQPPESMDMVRFYRERQ